MNSNEIASKINATNDEIVNLNHQIEALKSQISSLEILNHLLDSLDLESIDLNTVKLNDLLIEVVSRGKVLQVVDRKEVSSPKVVVESNTPDLIEEMLVSCDAYESTYNPTALIKPISEEKLKSKLG